MGLFTLLARIFPSRKKQSFLDRLAAAPLAPRRLERRRVLDASGLSAVLTPLGDGGEFVQAGPNLDSPPPQTAMALNGEPVENTPPDNLQIEPVADLLEDEVATLAFSFDDPDQQDTHSVDIDWGDGTPVETIELSDGERFVLTTHHYKDDNPTDTSFDLNQVSVTITDSAGNLLAGNTSLTVTNIEPEIKSLTVTPAVNEDGTAELELEFDDPGSLDTHTVDIDWGDGSPVETIELTGGERFVFTTHKYLDDNPSGTPSDVNQVKVTITDDDTGSDSAMANVTVSNLPPMVTLQPVSAIDENGVVTLSGKITDTGTQDTFLLTILWGDALSPPAAQNFSLGTTALTEAVHGINWDPTSRTFSLTHRYLDDNPSNSNQNLYAITAHVADDDLDVGTTGQAILVKNVAPTIDAFTVSSPVAEGQPVELNLEFTDPGQLDTHKVEIDWGDGATETIMLTGGERFVSTTHTYKDDNPTNTPFDLYQVKVKITDDDGGSDSDMATVQVDNALPVLTLNPVMMINENGAASLSGKIQDDGMLDTFTLEINWGDPASPDNIQSFALGTTVLTEAANGINWDPVTREFSLTHKYLDDNPTLTTQDTYTIAVTTKDDDGGVDETTTSVLVKNVPPQVTLQPVSTIDENGVVTLSGKITDTGTQDTFLLTILWGDALSPPVAQNFSLGTTALTEAVHGINWDPVSRTFSLSHQYLDDNPTNTSQNLYAITAHVADDDTDVGTTGQSILVKNVPPTIDSLTVSSPIEENGSTELQLEFTDPGTLDTHTVEINWGDGQVETINLTGGERFLLTSHLYKDDNPTVTDQDFYNITVKVTDDDTGTASMPTTVLVKNVAPVIKSLTATTPIDEDGSTQLELEFDDPGSLDSHTVRIDWGDGDIEMIELTGGERFIITSHQYKDDNPSGTPFDDYQIKVTVKDDDSGMDEAMTTVRVNNLKPTVELGDVMMLNEDGVTTLSGTISDTGTLDAFTIDINWGDPTSPDNVQSFMLGTTALDEMVDGINWDPGTRKFSLSHQYLDDNPSDTTQDNYTINVKVTDDDTGVGTDSAMVLVKNVAPEVTLGPVTMINENGLASLSGSISDVGTLDTFELEINWGDPLSPDNVQTFVLGTMALDEMADGINWDPATRKFSLSHQYLDDNPSATDQDTYTINVKATDDDSNEGTSSATVLVKNVAPEVTLGSVMMIDENGTASLSGSISDDSPLDTFTLEINWGDPLSPDNVQTFTLDTTALTEAVDGINWDPVSRTFSLTHKYLDDNPTGTAQDNYTINAKVTDDDSGVDADDTSVLVKNVAPVVTLQPVMEIDENGAATLSGSIQDVGTLDTFKLDITWGDPLSPDNMESFTLGTTALTEAADGINWDPITRTFSLTHQYLDDNPTGTDQDTYTITVKATDDDTDSHTAMASVLVKNVVPVPVLDSVMAINENGSAQLSGTITDVGTLDTFTEITINWGDPLSPNNEQTFLLGTVARTEAVDGINWDPITKKFSLSHQYLDDNPTDTSEDTYTITVKVTDDDTGIGTTPTTVVVNNVVPQVIVNPTATINEGGTVTVTGSVTDVGTLDTFTRLVVDWGLPGGGNNVEEHLLGTDPVSVGGFSWDPDTQTFTLTHLYVDNDDNNVSVITISITDDDRGTGVGEGAATVLNVNPSFLDADPDTANVIAATDVNTDGQTTLTLRFTDPGIEAAFLPNGLDAYQVLIDWGDMLNEPDLDARFIVEESYTILPTGEIQFVHQYTGPPDPLHPAADITIRVKIRDDDFYTATPLGAVGESIIVQDIISNPGIGTDEIRIDTTPQVPRLEFRREMETEFLEYAANSSETGLQSLDIRAVSADTKATTERILELRVVDSYGIESEGIRLKPDALKNLPKLFAKLPDNHYKVYLIRVDAGGTQERLVIEVDVRNGKVIDRGDDSEGTRDRPPTDETSRQQDEKLLDNSEPRPDNAASVEDALENLKSEATPGSEILFEPVSLDSDGAGAMRDPATGALMPVAVGLAATRSFGSWAQEVDKAVAEAGQKKWRELRRRSRNKRKNR